jgi:hypothetical protein
MSPLLFGLFIDSLEGELDSQLPEDGVPMGALPPAGRLLRLLLYADDLVLLAETPEALQRILDALHAFCGSHALTVSVRKSEGMVFNDQFCPVSSAGGQVTLKYAGADLPMTYGFTYLGMLFDHRMAVKGEPREAAGRRASNGVKRKCYAMDLHNVGIKAHLFNSLVRPVINAGCEIWGPGTMAEARGQEGIFSGAVDKWQPLPRGGGRGRGARGRGSRGRGRGPTAGADAAAAAAAGTGADAATAAAARAGRGEGGEAGGEREPQRARRNWRALEQLNLQFARESLHIRSNGQQLVAKEAGWRPLAAYWLRQAVRFYEKARRRPDGACSRRPCGRAGSWRRGARRDAGWRI